MYGEVNGDLLEGYGYKKRNRWKKPEGIWEKKRVYRRGGIHGTRQKKKERIGRNPVLTRLQLVLQSRNGGKEERLGKRPGIVWPPSLGDAVESVYREGNRTKARIAKVKTGGGERINTGVTIGGNE